MDSFSSFETSLGEMSVFSQELLAIALSFSVNILAGLGTIIIGFWLSSKAASIVRKQMSTLQRVDKTLAPILASIIRYAGFILTLVVALGQFGVQTTSIIAVLGAAGLAIGLALQGTLSNVASGIMLLLLRPFSVGDWIETNSISGTVREIGLFATQIDTFDNIYITVPNSSIWSATIINNSRHHIRRMDLDIGIGYNSDLNEVEKALITLTKDKRILSDPEPQFLVVDYADSAILVRLRLYAQYDDFFALNWDLKRRLKPLLDAHNIEIPFPQRVVHHLGTDSETGS
ncbi:MAG: small-conductance mechanosensitive channel [SAR116 cluster bacterium]|nr:small-conductance mechanosensitive channel [SAR116 cluster bacterium]RPG93099.1 MAG: mechanosensitive ion channel family protein [Candidatus Puniceispirillum sp. TMED213]|tara:strand:+ start:2087 stop:2950 length:864 start_codon:yes stop_codon:yes gene_type:complete